MLKIIGMGLLSVLLVFLLVKFTIFALGVVGIIFGFFIPIIIFAIAGGAIIFVVAKIIKQLKQKEFKMNSESKRTLIIGYIGAGLTWGIVNLPNLIESAKFNPFFAWGLGILRVVAWPIFFGIWLTKFIKNKKQSKKSED